jgi:glycosyltransferase involved in cell wall biosynthesis
MRTAIACAFNENAIWALSQHASRHGELVERLVPNWNLIADAAQSLSRLFPHASSLAAFASRKHTSVASMRLPEDRVVTSLTEVIRVAGARRRTPVTPFLGQYAWKALFDRRASAALTSEGVDVVIGMPGSCRTTFSRHSRPLKVFHAIDTHPRSRNHALYATYGPRAWGEAYSTALTRRIEDELALADVVLAPSRLVMSGMVSHGVPPEKLMHCTYGVDLERFVVGDPAPGQDVRRRPRLIFVGQISLRKGVPLLLEAVRDLDLDLTLAGQVFDRSLVKNLPRNVTLLGVLSPTELSRAYNRHDALVLPTVDDACSLVVAEAAASGLRVVTTTANGSAELLPVSHLVVPAGDKEQLQQALSSLVVLDRAARRRYAEEFRSGEDPRSRAWSSYADRVFVALDQRLEGGAHRVDSDGS